MKIAHISDLHFARVSYSIGQFFSKRWVGTINAFLLRGKDFLEERPHTLLPMFDKLGVTHVMISGDLSTTSFVREFHAAESFVDALKEAGYKVFLIPGNHDHYTKRSCKKRIFYDHFPESYGTYSLKKDGVTMTKLGKGWWLVCLDTTKAASIFASTGTFSPEVEKNLRKALGEIPAGEKVLLMNHFPFFEHEHPKRQLVRAGALKKVLKDHPQVQLYLNGHTHRHSLVDLRESNLPIVTDSGSVAHKTRGSWNFIHLTEKKCDLSVYKWNDGWKVSQEETYLWLELLRFKCTGCGKCCTGAPGYVWLSQDDIDRLSAFLGISEEVFLRTYTRKVGERYSLLEDPVNYDCVFLKEKKMCTVYEARPKQCQVFPWWPENLTSREAWESLGSYCEGIDHPDGDEVVSPIKANDRF